MRKLTDQALESTKKNAIALFVKFANFAPDEKITREEIENILYVLFQCETEINLIQNERHERRRAYDCL